MGVDHNAELTKSALSMALSRHQPKLGCLFRSDQGVCFTNLML